MSKQWIRGMSAVAAIVVVAAGCQELGVSNLNDPDRDRALSEPEDLEALISGVYGRAYNAWQQDAHIVGLMPAYATEMTAVQPGGQWTQGDYERGAFDNAASIPVDGGNLGVRNLWERWQEVASTASDGLRVLDAGVVIGDATRTARARAFAKLMQGLAWGEMSTIFDQVVVIPETQEVQSDARAQAIENMVSSEVARAAAMEALDAAIALAQQHTFTFPNFATTRLWFGTPDVMSSAQFIQLANTLKARFLVYSARTPADRRNVDWQSVLAFTENGMQDWDLRAELQPGVRTSTLIFYQEDNRPACGFCNRLDNNLIGPADMSGNYQAWLGAPLNSKGHFEITTADRRLTGVDAGGNPDPRAPGAYARFRNDQNGFPSGRSEYRRSSYQWQRHFNTGNQGLLWDQGSARLITADENRLLRAEALLRTGDHAGAAALINVTRTRSHVLPDGVTYPGLPAVTADGVPQSADCVPRHQNGACGDLMVALRWERMFELAGLTTTRGYVDGRAFGLLWENSMYEAPVPGTELEILGLPFYTHGGAGGLKSAAFAPTTMADL